MLCNISEITCSRDPYQGISDFPQTGVYESHWGRCCDWRLWWHIGRYKRDVSSGMLASARHRAAAMNTLRSWRWIGDVLAPLRMP